MTDKEEPHEPVLLPEDQVINHKEKDHEPVLLSEDHREKKLGTPHLFLILIILSILIAFWKVSMRKTPPVNMNENAVAEEISILDQQHDLIDQIMKDPQGFVPKEDQ